MGHSSVRPRVVENCCGDAPVRADSLTDVEDRRMHFPHQGACGAVSRFVRAGATSPPADGLGFADLGLEHVEILGLVCVGEVVDGEEITSDEIQAAIARHRCEEAL